MSRKNVMSSREGEENYPNNSIINGPYVRRMIPEPGDQNREVFVNETFHEQTDDELTEKELKQVEADDQAIQTILLGLPKDMITSDNGCNRLSHSNHVFPKLMNDFKRNKQFPEKIASNLKFLKNLQPEWSRHVTIVHQTKDLNTSIYTQLYDFLKYNQKQVKTDRCRWLEAMVGISLDSMLGRMLGIRMGIMQYRMSGIRLFRMQLRIWAFRMLEIKMGLLLLWGLLIRIRMGMDAAYLQTQLSIAQKEEVGIQLQAEEFDFMATVGDLEEIEEVNANCILMANLQQASTSEEQYTDLLEPIPEPHQVQQNNNNVISVVSSVEQNEETVEQNPATVKETRALYDSLYNNLAIEVEK
ncbi:hypothetical protein Tco_0115903 [Tanacetum coccineum]